MPPLQLCLATPDYLCEGVTSPPPPPHHAPVPPVAPVTVEWLGVVKVVSLTLTQVFAVVWYTGMDEPYDLQDIWGLVQAC